MTTRLYAISYVWESGRARLFNAREKGNDGINFVAQLGHRFGQDAARLQALLGPGAGMAKAMLGPVFVVMVLAMMVLPLPAWMLDLLFTFNIAMALMVMMVAAQMVRPLDFAAFPAVLLVTTLLRLSLNVASTRVVLLEGGRFQADGSPDAVMSDGSLMEKHGLEVPHSLTGTWHRHRGPAPGRRDLPG